MSPDLAQHAVQEHFVSSKAGVQPLTPTYLLQAKISVKSLPQSTWVCWLAFVAATACTTHIYSSGQQWTAHGGRCLC